MEPALKLWQKSPASAWMSRLQAIYAFLCIHFYILFLFMPLMFNDSLCQVFWLLTSLTVLLLLSHNSSIFPARLSSLVFCWIILLSLPLSMYERRDSLSSWSMAEPSLSELNDWLQQRTEVPLNHVSYIQSALSLRFHSSPPVLISSMLVRVFPVIQ